MNCNACDSPMPKTPAAKRTRLCIHCREGGQDHPRDIIVYESVDGNFYGTDLSEGCMDRVGACVSAGEAIRKMHAAALSPYEWQDAELIAAA